MMFDNSRYKEQQKKDRIAYRRLHYVCCECGLISKKRLTKAHPVKDGSICNECAEKLWK